MLEIPFVQVFPRLHAYFTDVSGQRIDFLIPRCGEMHDKTSPVRWIGPTLHQVFANQYVYDSGQGRLVLSAIFGQFLLREVGVLVQVFQYRPLIDRYAEIAAIELVLCVLLYPASRSLQQE